MRKACRNQLVVTTRQQQPDLSLAEIGAMFSISRQRVHQILHVEALKAARREGCEN